MPRISSLVVVLLCVWIAAAQSQEPGAQQTSTEQSAVDRSSRGMSADAPVARSAPAETLPEWWQSNGWWLVVALAVLGLIGAMLAMYTARVWNATLALLDHTKDMAKRELRAYVALDEIFFSEANEGAAGLHKLRIRNYGQTPASKMSIWCERASHLPQDGVNPFYDAPVVDVQLLHPVQAYTVGLAAAPLYRIGKPGFFTYGRIIYHDIYGDWWVTKFCFRYEGEGSFVPHGDYNAEEGPFAKKPA